MCRRRTVWEGSSAEDAGRWQPFAGHTRSGRRYYNCLLSLEDGVDALHGNDDLAFEMEDERRVLPVEQHDVDLVAEHAFAVDDVGARRLIALGQIGLKELNPDALASIALRAGVAEGVASHHQSPLDVIVESGKQLS